MSLMEPEDLPEFVTIDQITDAEWALIKLKGEVHLRSGDYGADALKCAVQGFLEWLVESERQIGVAEEDVKKLH